MNHSNKETIAHTEAVANTRDNSGVKMDKSSIQEQYEYWAQTLSFPSYVIDEYKKKYPTTYIELRLDGLNKQQAARYIYHNCEPSGGGEGIDKMFDVDFDDSRPIYKSGFGFIRGLSD